VHDSVGATFEVKLATCADCGDSWRWVHRPGKHIVKELSKRIVTNVKPPATQNCSQPWQPAVKMTA
jgi:hypothetical protein